MLNTLKSATVLNPATGTTTPLLDGLATSRNVVVLLPQVGEFDSYEFCEQLTAVADDLKAAGLGLRVVGVGDADAGKRFEAFVGLPEGVLRVDPQRPCTESSGSTAAPAGAGPSGSRTTRCASYSGRCPAGPGRRRTAQARRRRVVELLINVRGHRCARYVAGDCERLLRRQERAERLRPDAVVSVGDVIEIGPGVGPVKLGPFRYENSWKDETGYQRPVELATVRLRAMVEVLGNWDAYVSDPRYVDVRGATYIVDGDELLYEYKHRGVLTYSATMSRPLSLAPFIGARALNPLGLGDNGVSSA